MLEFQEGFFDQEVREGFYLDTTMKTVWAAELEVLQCVAEICDKYGFRWYAAYGTMLGILRHEGFVPWDDDMDIWVMRNDYNKLMQVLPKELPDGFLVRGPLTDEGYDQFHTCINSGSGICIKKEWLDRFHGCPFTVGLDVFPLDYLPRDPEEQSLQKNLFTLTGRVAQLAKNIGKGDYEKDDAKQTVEEVKEEILEGIEYLETNCNFKINRDLYEEEKWSELSSEMWKFANYIASMYDESESDLIVEYLDYVRFENKKFPKEWFSETYAGKFENFMLPIPKEYDKIMKTVYASYTVRAKKTGYHEYPYYARQLRQLREYVKSVEQRAENVGMIQIDEIEIPEESFEIPLEWKKYIYNSHGKRKTIVLMANDINEYMRHGKEALAALKKRIEYFKEEKEKLLLWWRPHPFMSKALNNIDKDYAAEYENIVENYKSEDWGIYDDSDNTDRAVALCDVYYGEMNAILQPFQEENKAIILTYEDTSENKDTNRLKILETQSYENFTDFVEVDDKMYFANTNYNALIIAEKETGKIYKMIPFEERDITQKNIHLKCVEKNGRILFLPVGNGQLTVFNPNTENQKVLKEWNDVSDAKTTWDYIELEDELYLLPGHMEQGIWRWNPQSDGVEKLDWWQPGEAEGELKHGKMDNNRAFTLIQKSNILIITDFIQKTVRYCELPDSDINSIQYDGENFWYTMWESPELVCWNVEKGIVKRHSIPGDGYTGRPFTPYYFNMILIGKNLFMTSRTGENLYLFDTESEEMTCLDVMDFDEWDFIQFDKEPFFVIEDNTLIYAMRNTNKFRKISLSDYTVTTYTNYFKKDEEAMGYRDKVLLHRGILFFEEKGVFDITTLARY